MTNNPHFKSAAGRRRKDDDSSMLERFRKLGSALNAFLREKKYGIKLRIMMYASLIAIRIARSLLKGGPQELQKTNPRYEGVKLSIPPTAILPKSPLTIENVFNVDRISKEQLESGETIKVGSYRIWFDSKYNAIRTLEVGKNIVLTFILNKNKQIVGITCYAGERDRDATLRFLQGLDQIGIIKGKFSNLDESESDIRRVKKIEELEREMMDTLEQRQRRGRRIDWLEFPPLSLDPIIVLQGQGVIMNVKESKKEGDNDSLYTFGAEPCLILCIIEKEDKSTTKIGLAHIDAGTSERSIRQFIDHFDTESISISIISGARDTVLKVFGIIKKMGLVSKIDYFDVDFDGSRSDAVCVDREGTIYYGNVPSWNRKANEQQLELYARSIPLRPASMWNLEITEV